MESNRFPERISEAVVRVVAGEVFLLSLLAMVTRLHWLALILGLDFALRAFVNPRWSLLSFAARKLFVPLFGFRGEAIAFAPKRFAAGIGFTLSAGAFLLALFSATSWWLAPLAVLWLFSGLESFLGFCAGCKIYGLLMLCNIVPEQDCPQCRFRKARAV